MTRIAVLGGGLVGGFIARELVREDGIAVTLCDRDEGALARSKAAAQMKTRCIDLANKAQLSDAVHDADIVVGAVPGFMGFETLRTVIEQGKPCVDISFFPEDPFALDELARERGVVAVVDCGVMPGLGGMLASHLAARLDSAESLAIYVGGLPEERDGVTDYKAPFSPVDVIEEYLRPARMVQHGEIAILPALSGVELLDCGAVGQLEAFNTDGLRSLIDTLAIAEMKEKTLRYPGHPEKMRTLRELGFFADEPRRIGGAEVSPREVTTQLLRQAWQLKPGDREFTVMRVEVTGMKDGTRRTLRAELLDRTDARGEFSMARTTGYPAVFCALALARGELRWEREARPWLKRAGGDCGIICPEWLGTTASMPALLEFLALRGVEVALTSVP